MGRPDHLYGGDAAEHRFRGIGQPEHRRPLRGSPQVGVRNLLWGAVTVVRFYLRGNRVEPYQRMPFRLGRRGIGQSVNSILQLDAQ